MNSTDDDSLADEAPVTTRILIIGAGFGGLCIAAMLRQAGINDFLILEKAQEVGGTWRENTYPGAECDVASALYSFSFAQNPTWEFRWAGQAQILAYLKKISADFGIRPHLRFGRTVTEAVFDEKRGRWRVLTMTGEVYDSDFLVSAVGQLNHPKNPDPPGRELFKGSAFHSAEWQHDVAMDGESVAVIGNAASAIQLVPELAQRAETLTVYQRSANWILPKHNRPYSRPAKSLARVFPGLARLYRLQTWLLGEYLLYPVIRGARIRKALTEWVCKREIRKHIKDTRLRTALVPDYPIGAKRVLLSDKYYPTLARGNVRLVTSAIQRMTANGILTDDDVERSHDVIVYATGFRTNPFLQAIRVAGRDGRILSQHWRQGAHAYLGVMTAGYPNLFMMYGPNTNTGHSSVIYFHEAQARLIARLIAAAGGGTIEVREDAEAAYNRELQSRLETLAWSRVQDSWYKDGQRITNNWPGTAREYARRTRRPDWSHFLVNSEA